VCVSQEAGGWVCGYVGVWVCGVGRGESGHNERVGGDEWTVDLWL
jgi:hypothetical protein